MSKRIFKYHLQPVGSQIVRMPIEAEVFSVIEQDGNIIVYAIVDPNSEEDFHRFTVLGTGWEIEDGQLDGHRFVGTVKQGVYVWHVFYQGI